VTVEQVSINDRAIREQADRLTATGWEGDSHRFVESLLLGAISAGWRRVDPVPPVRPDSIADPNGPGRTEFRNAVAGLANRKKEVR
jgi:hypothetical protein